MIVVIFVATLFVYFLFIFRRRSAGRLQQQQRRLTREDLARLRANTTGPLLAGAL